MTNPSLTAALRVDYEALRNDLQQVTDLAADFQAQLAGKSNEVAHLKQVFEKTAHDLAQLQTSITELRQERHRLANEAMRATALERKLAEANAERVRLREQVEAMEQGLAGVAEEADRRVRDRDMHIARLALEAEMLKQQLSLMRIEPPPTTAPAWENDAEVNSLLVTLSTSIERLRKIVEPGSVSPKAAPRVAPPTADEFIDISFAS